MLYACAGSGSCLGGDWSAPRHSLLVAGLHADAGERSRGDALPFSVTSTEPGWILSPWIPSLMRLPPTRKGHKRRTGAR